MKELRYEFRKFKEHNERILKAQEEPNDVLLAKIHNNEKEKIRNMSNKFLKLHLTIVRAESWNFSAINLKIQVKRQLNITENNKSQAKAMTITKIIE